MTVSEAKKAIKNKTIIKHKDMPDSFWGILTCLSDDESTAYYMIHGASLFRSNMLTKDIVKEK